MSNNCIQFLLFWWALLMADWKWAIIKEILHTCTVTAVTYQNICCDKGFAAWFNCVRVQVHVFIHTLSVSLSLLSMDVFVFSLSSIQAKTLPYQTMPTIHQPCTLSCTEWFLNHHNRADIWYKMYVMLDLAAEIPPAAFILTFKKRKRQIANCYCVSILPMKRPNFNLLPLL